MDQTDKALEALKVQIKKEIIDNYFADRVYLEEDGEILRQEVEAYRREYELIGRRFLALYQALGSETACGLFMEVLKLKDWPFYPQFCALPEPERPELLKGCPRRGWTAFGRYRNLVFDLYEQLRLASDQLGETRAKIVTHVKLLNEDIDKFNLSYDFGLIAAQIEAMEGRSEVMSGGLLVPEREELSTRMRGKRWKLTDEDLPPALTLPPLKEIKGRLAQMLKDAGLKEA
jgi:hypothetical protein